MRSLSLLSAIFLLGAGGAAAQSITSPYRYIETTHSVGLDVGYLFTDTGGEDLGPRSAPLVELRYTGRLSGGLSGVVGLGFLPSERHIFRLNEEGEQILAGESSLPILFAEAGLLFRITGPRTWHGLAPYVIATGGLATTLSDDSPLEEDIPAAQHFDFGPAFAVGVGLGTEWFVSDRLSLRLEARDLIWRLEVPEGLRTGTVEESEWTNNLGLTIGAALHF